MRLFMDFVFGLGQVLVRTLWVKSVGSAHWLVRQWVISVTELSLDLKADKWQKSGSSLHCFWKSELWFRRVNERQICEKTFLYTLVVGGFGRHFFWASSARITWVFHELQYPGHFRLDSNLGPSVYGLNNHGRPAWGVSALAEGWFYKKSLFVSFLPNIHRAQEGNKEM